MKQTKKTNNIKIKLFCINCKLNKKKCYFFYSTTKNKKNTEYKLSISKYCNICNKHTIHKEMNK